MPITETDIIKEELKLVPYHYIEQIYIRKVHHFYLSSVIEEPIKYTDMIHQIQSALPDDDIHLHLNFQGGNLSTGIQMINALNMTEAHVICSLEAEAHSLGTLLFLSADEFLVHDNCTMLFHNFSGGIYGKGNEQAAELESTMRWFNDIIQRIYIPFLSKSEVARILKGEDFWFHSDEIRKRLTSMVAEMTKKTKPAKKKSTKTTS